MTRVSPGSGQVDSAVDGAMPAATAPSRAAPLAEACSVAPSATGMFRTSAMICCHRRLTPPPAHEIQALAEGERHSLQDRPGHLRGPVPDSETHQRAARGRVEMRGPLAP